MESSLVFQDPPSVRWGEGKALIRELRTNDRSRLEDILRKTGQFTGEEVGVAMELIDVCLNVAGQKDYTVFVHEDVETGGAAGYICYGRRPLTDTTFDLYWIAVDPEIHGRGIGSGLIRYMEKELMRSGGKLVLIETSGKENYANERRFYEKNGYTVQTVVKDFYRKGDDLVVYRKYL